MIRVVPTIYATDVEKAMSLYESMLKGAKIGAIHKDPTGDVMRGELNLNGTPVEYFTQARKEGHVFGQTVFGNNVQICVDFDVLEEIDHAYNVLKNSAGSIVLVELANSQWGARFGAVKDSYGVVWHMNMQLQK